jgi:hypothetical protein
MEVSDCLSSSIRMNSNYQICVLVTTCLHNICIFLHFLLGLQTVIFIFFEMR